MYDEIGGGVAGLAQMKAREMSINRMPSFTERVAMSLEETEQRLKDLKRMQEIFAQHPEFEELLTLVQRGRI